MFTAHCAFDILRHPKERLNTAHDIVASAAIRDKICWGGATIDFGNGDVFAVIY